MVGDPLAFCKFKVLHGREFGRASRSELTNEMQLKWLRYGSRWNYSISIETSRLSVWKSPNKSLIGPAKPLRMQKESSAGRIEEKFEPRIASEHVIMLGFLPKVADTFCCFGEKNLQSKEQLRSWFYFFLEMQSVEELWRQKSATTIAFCYRFILMNIFAAKQPQMGMFFNIMNNYKCFMSWCIAN